MVKIKAIIKKRYVGTVYDLAIKDLKAYNIEGLSVHNSAVGSLALYVLGVTKIDPLKYDLLFERFLNPDRVSPPDVDLDFDYDRRGEVYDYVVRKYGTDFCCQIGTYNQLRARAVIRGSAKALDLAEDWETYQKAKKANPDAKIEMGNKSLDLADTMSKLIPEKVGTTIASAVKVCEDFREYMSMYPKLLEIVQKIEGTFSYAGVHAAGIIACKDPVIEKIPLKLSKGVVCSQFDKEEVEDLGLLKFDLLALKTLTVIDKTIKLIKKRHNKDIDIDNLVPNDQAIFRILNGRDKAKDINGVFQFESYGMTKLLAAIRVDTFEDMIVAAALYRPGPLGAGVHNMYCDYKHGRKAVEYIHPKMGEILKDTYGMMIFQEDIMKVARKLAGLTAGQSDTLRKAVGKKKKDLMAKQEKLFIDGCVTNGVDKTVAKEIFKKIDFFGEYGFNRCLSGDTLILNKSDNSKYRLEELEKIIHNNDYRYTDGNFIVDSYVDGKSVEDEIVDVFETGEKEVYEVELSNGMVVKCTLDHKFYCSDGEPHTVKEIMEKDLDIICES